MKCSTARNLIGPDPGPRGTTPEGDQALAHYARCPACRSFYQGQQAVRDRLGNLAVGRTAPGNVRDRVLAAIAAEGGVVEPISRKSPIIWKVGAGLVAAAAALVIGLGVSTRLAEQDVAFAPMVLEALQPRLPSTVMETSDPEPLLAWFATQNVPAFEIPEIENASLKRGRIIEVAGRTSAAVDFVRNGLELTYVMAPIDEWITVLRENGIRSASSDGYEVAMWEEDGTARAVLSLMPRQELRTIAEQCKNKRSG